MENATFEKLETLIANAPQEAELRIPIFDEDGNQDVQVVMVKTSIPFAERESMVDNMADIIYADGAYHAGRVLFARGWAVLSYYTDIELPSDPSRVWSLITMTDIVDHASELIVDDIGEALDAGVRMARIKMESESTANTAKLLTALRVLTASASSLIDGLDLGIINGAIADAEPENVVEFAQPETPKKAAAKKPRKPAAKKPAAKK